MDYIFSLLSTVNFENKQDTAQIEAKNTTGFLAVKGHFMHECGKGKS